MVAVAGLFVARFVFNLADFRVIQERGAMAEAMCRSLVNPLVWTLEHVAYSVQKGAGPPDPGPISLQILGLLLILGGVVVYGKVYPCRRKLARVGPAESADASLVSSAISG